MSDILVCETLPNVSAGTAMGWGTHGPQPFRVQSDTRVLLNCVCVCVCATSEPKLYLGP